MPDFYDGDEATKEYDPKLFSRIMSYIRPHKALVAVTFIALAVSTVGELFVPILIRGVLDDAVFPSYRSTEAEKLVADPRTVSINAPSGVRHFVPKAALASLSRSEEQNLIDQGLLSSGEWYVFSFPAESHASEITARHGEIFLTSAQMEKSVVPVLRSAVRLSDLSALPLDERKTVRASDYRKIEKAVIIFALLLLAVLAATFAQSYTAGLLGQRVMTDIRLSLFNRVCSQSLAFLSRHPVGRLVTRMTGDVETINDFFTSVLVSFLKDVSIMVGVLIALFSLSPRLAVIVMCTLPPVAAVTFYSRVKARDAFRRQRSAVSKVNSYLAERLAGFHVVQLFTKERESAAEFAQRDKELLNANLGEMYVFASFRPLIDFLSALTTAVVIGFGAYFFLGSSISLGVLIAFVNLVAMFYSPVQDISEKYTMLQSAMAGSERIFKLLDTDESIPDHPSAASPDRIRGRIEFESVRFSYKRDEEILKGLSFTVEEGETVAIVGPTGAGKTTITNLIARLWDVSEGEIRIDGVPIKEMTLSFLRRSVLPVLQEVFLFSGTIAENIRLGSEMSDDEVVAAAKAVYADEFISRLPDGYATVLSEGATNISSGQRQLISFARVIAHDPRVVILDEATSSIDTETERLIQKGLARVLSGRTAIVIAHRLSTIRHADRILVLSGGRIIEQGAHAELLALNGIYAKLYELQYEHLRT